MQKKKSATSRNDKVPSRLSKAQRDKINKKPKPRRKNDKPLNNDKSRIHIIVAIGASAGGLEALSQLLSAIPRDIGMAYIVIQHLAAKQHSMLTELLGQATDLPVMQVEEGMRVAPDTVYVIPPNAQMGINNGILHLVPRPTDKSQHTPINFFLSSLAKDVDSRAIGVILSGTASDGAEGLRDIKGVGGIVLVQDPKTAKYDGMPRAAIATGVADMVLSPIEIAHELIRIARHPFVRPEKLPLPSEEIPLIDDHLQRIFFLLRNSSGVDFTHYKQPTIRRRLQRRMILHKITTTDQYLKFLRQNPAELDALYQDLLIHVTRFFREPESFEILTKKVFPAATSNRAENEPIRIWIPGCSTGEEAYSVAVVLMEYLGESAGNTPVQIFATDISEQAIERARAGVYPETIKADVSPERLRRFFTKIDGSYRVGKHIRDSCIFARQDLTRDPPFSKLDLIVCRNVLIYLGPVLQKKLMNVFHYALKPTGFLMLGGSETIGTHSDLFSMADKRHKLYARKIASGRASFDLPSNQYTASRMDPGRKSATDSGIDSRALGEANRVLLTRYSPPAVIVDSYGQITQFRGQTAPFLQSSSGEASLNILKMAREGLFYDIRRALHEARRQDEPVQRPGLHVKHDGILLDVDLDVVPLTATGDERHFLVLFKTPNHHFSPAPLPRSRAKRPAKPAEEKHVLRLQQEIAASRNYLQSIIQDLEAANEELQSANEEILSSNEELQSTNEELDTAKEELQSTNEELNTVNEELQGRNEELSRVNSDLINLLASVEIAIVMVASDLRIRRFTPMAERVLNLIASDIGRPISDIKPNIDCPDLEQLITSAIDTITVKERNVRDRKGAWYSMRIRPYKNIENKIDGAVVALFRIESPEGKTTQSAQERQHT